MKKISIGLCAFLFPVTVLAQEAPNANLKLTSPTPGSTVSGPFTVRIEKNPSCRLAFGLRNTDASGAGGSIGDSESTNGYAGMSVVEIQVDPGVDLVDNSPGQGDDLSLNPGQIAVTYLNLNPCSGPSDNNRLATLSYDPNADQPQATSSPTERPTPSETPAPSVTPVPTEDSDDIDPVLALVLGALAGGVLTGLAEYSWIRHQRKHGKK